MLAFHFEEDTMLYTERRYAKAKILNCFDGNCQIKTNPDHKGRKGVITLASIHLVSFNAVLPNCFCQMCPTALSDELKCPFNNLSCS